MAADVPHADRASGKLVVLELFAGIGGMRLALESIVSAETLSFVAVEVSEPCRLAYESNFAGSHIVNRNVEQLPKAWFDTLGAQLWTLSPPCQPFTNTLDARQQDADDARCAALQHLCDVLPELQTPPCRILLENVKGFVGSRMHARWLQALAHAGYSSRQFMLSPQRAGFSPNERTRYYCMAERSDRFGAFAHAPPVRRSGVSPASICPRPFILPCILPMNADGL